MAAALLIDIDGTLSQQGRLIPGAVEALDRLAARGVTFCFVTNMTSRPRRVLVDELAAMGYRVAPEAIVSAPRATRDYLITRGFSRCCLLVRRAVLEDFEGIDSVERDADAVVVGDLGAEMSFERLNAAFRCLREGAELVAMARNRFFLAEDGVALDVGPFVVALEYAAGCEATLVGKPSTAFFRAALAGLGVAARDAVVVGDDLEGDVGGAQSAGMRGVLVRTGKFREQDLRRSSVRPDAVVDSLAVIDSVLDF